MKKEIVASSLWFLFAVYFTAEAYRFGLGEWSRPGPGYFPFGAGFLFGITSLVTMISALTGPHGQRSTEPREKFLLSNIVSILAGMLVYILLFRRVGFIFCTFFLSLFLVRIVARGRWLNSLIVSALVTAAFYLFFDRLLNAQLPLGPFELLRG